MRAKLATKLIFLMSIGIGPLQVGAQSLFKDGTAFQTRQFIEDLRLRQPDLPYRFTNFQPTFFERLTDAQAHTPRERRLLETHWSSDPSLKVSARAFSFREAPLRVVSSGTSEYPVLYQNFTYGAEGLPVAEGEGAYSQMEAQAAWKDFWMARASLRAGTGAHSWWQLQQAYTELRFRKLVLSVGRKPIYWGQANQAALLIGDHAQNMDIIQISTLPQRWGWWFDYLGELKAEAFLARMNADRPIPNDFIFGWRVGATPFDWIEVGAALVYQFGGEGVESTNFIDLFYEFLGTRGRKSEKQADNSHNSNRSAVFDLRINLDGLAWPTTFYAEHHLADCCGTPRNIFIYAFSYTYGAYTRTSRDPDAHRFRVEFSQLGDFIYRHWKWRAGHTNRNRVLGHPLGRDGTGLYLKYSRFLPAHNTEFELTGFYENRSRHGMRGWKPTVEVFPEIESPEKRLGLNVWAEKFLRPSLSVNASLGAHRIFGWNYEHAHNRWAWGLQTGLDYHF